MRHAGISQGLTLVTGATGSGKTALVVDWLRRSSGRQLLVHGIPELGVVHDVAPPVADWCEMRPAPEDAALELAYFRLPQGCVLVVDEAQRVYPPRTIGSKVPAHVAALSTRRHVGVDVILVTQHPGLLDSAVRKLVNRHYHVHTTAYGAFLLFWDGSIGEPSESSSRQLAERVRYSPPKEVFELYRSAEIHTAKVRRIPRAAVFGGVLVVVALAVGGFLYQRLHDRQQPEQAASAASAPAAAGLPTAGHEGKRAALGYVAARVPAVEGLAHTAPAYESLAQVKAVPYPVGCVASRSDCRCYDQRGGLYRVSVDICRQWLKHPPFLDFLPDVDLENGERLAIGSKSASGAGEPSVGVVSASAGHGVSGSGGLGGDGRASGQRQPAASSAGRPAG